MMMTQEQTILMVDDSEDDLLLMRSACVVAKLHFRLQEAQGGEKAIAYLQGIGPYGDRKRFPLPIVMLLDLNMPKINGFETLAWVRAQPGLKRLAVVILSASIRIEDVDRSFDLGATSFLVKPSTLDELVVMMSCLGAWIDVNRYPRLEEEPKR